MARMAGFFSPVKLVSSSISLWIPQAVLVEKKPAILALVGERGCS